MGAWFAVFIALAYGWLEPAAAAGPSVSIVDFGYAPGSISVSVGTTVAWLDTGSAPHSVTSDVAGQFDSSPACPSPGPCVTSGQTYTHTFDAAGTFAYHCRVHPTMHGSVVVVASPPTTPAPSSSVPTATTQMSSVAARARTPVGPPSVASANLASTGSRADLGQLVGVGALLVIAGAWLRRFGAEEPPDEPREDASDPIGSLDRSDCGRVGTP